MKTQKHQCRFCTFETKYKNIAKQHEQKEHGVFDSPIECRVCGQTCEGESGVKIHMKKTHPARYSSQLAPRKELLPSVDTFGNTSKKRKKRTTYKFCKICNQKCRGNIGLGRHMSMVHNQNRTNEAGKSNVPFTVEKIAKRRIHLIASECKKAEMTVMDTFDNPQKKQRTRKFKHVLNLLYGKK